MSKAHMHIHGLQKMSLEQKTDQVDTDLITPMIQAFVFLSGKLHLSIIIQ